MAGLGCVTRRLAQFASTQSLQDLPKELIHLGKRSLLNSLAVALSASPQEGSQTLIDWARSEGAAPRASIIGSSGLRSSPGTAALVNGFLIHLQDYDDTHFPTILHPSAPVWPAVLAAADDVGASGSQVLAAGVLGLEVACRVAMSVHPWHYDAGWHITGTAGVFGAAAGASAVLGLSTDQTVNAMGLAGTFAAGVREVFGTHGKALHAGRSAQAGLEAAMWAKAGLSGPEDIIGGRRGFWAVHSPNGHNKDALVGNLGSHWESNMNALKPFANGIVSHPLQDAAIRLRAKHSIRPGDVVSIEARVHPLVLELMNRPHPQTGLQGKFSHQHCVAAALVDGAGHDAQFTDEKVQDSVISALRDRVVASVDKGIREEEVHLVVILKDGRRLEQHVERAIGSPENPMSDVYLEQKFREIAGVIVGHGRCEEVIHQVWSLDNAPSIGKLTQLTG